PGAFVVFRRFVPPYDETRPVAEELMWVGTLDGTPVSAAVLDRNTATEWRSPLGIARGTGVAVRVTEPRRLSALVLGVDLSPCPTAPGTRPTSSARAGGRGTGSGWTWRAWTTAGSSIELGGASGAPPGPPLAARECGPSVSEVPLARLHVVEARSNRAPLAAV